MNNPFFWLGISILLVAISLMALLTVAILVLQELARAARSAEKLLDTLNRELPPTLNDLRLTGRELSDLSDEVSDGVQSARHVVQQVDKGLSEAKVQARRAHITGRSFVAGATAALRVLAGNPRRRRRPPTRRPPVVPIRSPEQTPGKPPVAKQNVRQDVSQNVRQAERQPNPSSQQVEPQIEPEVKPEVKPKVEPNTQR
ncbi:MAG: DUF948 domain-containing protein [Cyanobacteria bacterium J06614_10]